MARRVTLESSDAAPRPAAASLRDQVGAALRWTAANSVLQRVCQLGVGILLARLIAPEQFGVFAVALTALNIVISVSELGVSVALVRHDGDPDKIAPTVATLSLLSGTVLAGLMAATAPLFAAWMNAPDATNVIRLMSVALIVAGASAVPGAMMQRNFRQDQKFAADTSAFVAGTAIAVVLAVAGFGAWSLAWSRIGTNVVGAVVMFALVRTRYRPGFDPAVARGLLAFGLPLAGSSLLVFAVLNLDYVVVGSILGPVDLAFYLMAFNLSSWPVGAFSMPVRSVSLPAFARVRHDQERLQGAFRTALGLLALLTVPACALLAALGTPLVTFVYGTEWARAAEPLALLAVLGALRVALELCYDFLASSGRSRTILAIHVGWLAALVPALVLGARLDGIRGVALAHVTVALLLIVPVYLHALGRFGVRPAAVVRSVALPVMGGAAMAGVGLAVQRIVGGALPQLALGSVLALLVYLVAVLPMRRQVAGLLRREGA